MAVDKILEIDLNNLTAESIEAIDNQFDTILKEFQNPERRGIKERFGDPLLTPSIDKQSGLKKIFGVETFKNLFSIGSNPAGFFQSSIIKFIPFIGTALAATGIILKIITDIDNFQKEFVDRVDGRISLSRTKEQQALVQAGLQQLIITTEAGSAEPRDAYNTFNEFNTNQQRIETDFQIKNTSGVS